jgi:L-rhamnose mutarotase
MGPQRTAFRIRIRPDRVDEYVAAHRDVWPELRRALTAAGIRNYSIFLDGTVAFGYYEADDLDAADRFMSGLDVNARWQAAMAPLIDERIEGVGPSRLPEIFRLD